MASRSTFALGDWLVWADGQGLLRDKDGGFADLWGHASLLAGRSYAWLLEAMHVSRLFPFADCRVKLAWPCTYREAARLTTSREREGALRTAEQNHWTIGEMADFVSGRGHVPIEIQGQHDEPLSDAPVPMKRRWHGKSTGVQKLRKDDMPAMRSIVRAALTFQMKPCGRSDAQS